MHMKRILIVGAGGQIGSELTVYLRKIYGDHNVVATDMRECKALGEAGPFEVLNALDATAMASVVARYHIDTIFNLVALLSAVGERNPQMAWNVNMGALNNSLEVARQHHCALFTPSSIGAFGPSSPKDKTPQDTIMQPTTIYGICKVTGEMLGNYYHHKYGVDTRSVRFPGIISNVTLPGGGTTDYAVEIYYEAIRSGRFTCPVPSDVYMDMIYMPDALRACVELMEADPAKLVHRNSFPIASMSFCLLYTSSMSALTSSIRSFSTTGSLPMSSLPSSMRVMVETSESRCRSRSTCAQLFSRNAVRFSAVRQGLASSVSR